MAQLGGNVPMGLKIPFDFKPNKTVDLHYLMAAIEADMPVDLMDEWLTVLSPLSDGKKTPRSIFFALWFLDIYPHFQVGVARQPIPTGHRVTYREGCEVCGGVSIHGMRLCRKHSPNGNSKIT